MAEGPDPSTEIGLEVEEDETGLVTFLCPLCASYVRHGFCIFDI